MFAANNTLIFPEPDGAFLDLSFLNTTKPDASLLLARRTV